MSDAERSRFETAVLPHLDSAYTLACYLLRDEHDAQDAVQEAALRAFRYFESYREGDSRAWFLAIVRNCCVGWKQRYRNEQRVERIDVNSAIILRDTSESDRNAVVRSDRDAIRRAIQTLPEEFREVIVLRELEELSYNQISAIVGVPMGTVMSRLSRGRKQLAQLLGNLREAM